MRKNCYITFVDTPEETDDDIAQAIIDLTNENDELRQIIQDVEACAKGTQEKNDQVRSNVFLGFMHAFVCYRSGEMDNNGAVSVSMSIFSAIS